MSEPWKDFSGPNQAYLLELYERYRRDPNAVDAPTRAFFEVNPPPPFLSSPPAFAEAPRGAPTPVDVAAAGAAAGALELAQSIRWYGHWAAHLDPLGSPPADDPALRLETYGLDEAGLRRLPASLIGGPAGERAAGQGGSAWEAIAILRSIYSGTVGYDYLQIRNPQERAWLREAAESQRFSAANDPIDAPALLDRLTQVETFEHFLQRSFVAKTRFSIEGLDMLIPLLDEVIGRAAAAGIYRVLIGMAHRGRLNVLAHTLHKPIEQILAEFKDPLMRRVIQNEPNGWTGDVKYHAGGRRTIDPDSDPATINLTISMAPNPSHLEAVNPVVAGMARAAGTRADGPGQAPFEPSVTLPVVIHGDAAFPGQGVVAETLNLHRLRGFSSGGAIHVIANNQIGFTTTPGEARSTLFASDLAKGFRIPVMHVNADDPEAVLLAARTAFAYRERFHKDFLIDLIGYRRLGHNEGDEPAFTQPLLYGKIAAHPSVRALWGAQLVQRGEVPEGQPEALYQQRMEALQATLDRLDPPALEGSLEESLEDSTAAEPPPGAARQVRTAVPLEELREMNAALLRLPDGFTLHPRLARIRQRRAGIFGPEDGAGADWDAHQPAVDWGAAEELALASILRAGTPVRLTGQDTERGTFSHRHAVLHDAQSGESFTPLHALPGARAPFDVFNGPLSEYAALGFEFGFNVEARRWLVIWEAQYGDFINNAQTVVDEFLVSARDKWGQLPSLVLLLPHGYEGQGPDHSSARPERFLNLAADNNLRVANCTTAANYFHLLRRQAALLEVDPLPLVVLTPKSLLRHPLAISPPADFSEGGWQPVIDRTPLPARAGEPREPLLPSEPLLPRESVRRLALCSGKVYVDLVTSEAAARCPEVAVARIEQLAPFPLAEVQALLAGYPRLDALVWVQEEPENMGAWAHVQPYLLRALAGRAPLELAARPRSASPAEGSNNLHTYHQRRLVERALEPEKS